MVNPSASAPPTEAATVLTQMTENNRTVAPMTVPPDGGWGWVVVMVGLLGSLLEDGMIYCFYLFREPVAKELKVTLADISFISSLNNGMYFIGAVFACSFGNQWGFRPTMVVGGLITSLSYASGYFHHHIVYFYLTVGFLAGVGSGFICMASNLPSGFYFDKKRSIAMGIVSSGSGIGAIVMPPVMEMFMKHFGWRNTYLFAGALIASLILLGMLILPLKPVMVVIENDLLQNDLNKSEDDSFENMSAFRIPLNVPLPPIDAHSYISEGRSILGRSVISGVVRSTHPTIAEVTDRSVINIRVQSPGTHHNVITRLNRMNQPRSGQEQAEQATSSFYSVRNIRISHDPVVKRRLPWYKCGCCRSKQETLPQRPLMRTDILYTGSLARLPEYKNAERDLEYHLNVTRVPTYYQIVQDLTKNYTIWCCHNIVFGLQYLIDFRMLKSLTFDCLGICGLGVYTAFYLPFIFCKAHLERIGEGAHTSILVSMIGVGGLFGRFLSGIIITVVPKINARIAVSTMMFNAGLSIFWFVTIDNLIVKGMCLIMYGFTIGFFVPLRSIIIVDYFGLEKLTSTTGVLFLCLGLGSFLGPTLSEAAIKWTHNKDAPFFVCGISLVISSFALMPMDLLSKWEKKRKERKISNREETL